MKTKSEYYYYEIITIKLRKDIRCKEKILSEVIKKYRSIFKKLSKGYNIDLQKTIKLYSTKIIDAVLIYTEGNLNKSAELLNCSVEDIKTLIEEYPQYFYFFSIFPDKKLA